MALDNTPQTTSGGKRTTYVKVFHPSGWVEDTTIERIRSVFDMSLDEYRYFVATEPEGGAARSRRRKHRKTEVAEGVQAPFVVPSVGVDGGVPPLAKVETVLVLGGLREQGAGRGRDRESETDQRWWEKGTDYSLARRMNIFIPEAELTHETRREKWQRPWGTRMPGFPEKGRFKAKTSYVVSSRQPLAQADSAAEDDEGVGELATLLISSLPYDQDKAVQRSYWEDGLIDLYYNIYGSKWRHWQSLIPWLDSKQLEEKARELGYSGTWGWFSMRTFLEDHGFRWSIDELERLLSWYCERGAGVPISGKESEEVEEVAKALDLPTRLTIEELARCARSLV